MSIGRTRFTCDICQSSYTMKHNLRNHLKTHISHLNEQNLVLREVKSNESTTVKTAQFSCDLCKAYYNVIFSLQKHLNNHIGKDLHQCSLCEVSLSSASHLKRHYRIHSGEKPYECKSMFSNI